MFIQTSNYGVSLVIKVVHKKSITCKGRIFVKMSIYHQVQKSVQHQKDLFIDIILIK